MIIGSTASPDLDRLLLTWTHESLDKIYNHKVLTLNDVILQSFGSKSTFLFIFVRRDSKKKKNPVCRKVVDDWIELRIISSWHYELLAPKGPCHLGVIKSLLKEKDWLGQ